MSTAQSYALAMCIKQGSTCLDEAVAPVVSEDWVPEARGGRSGFGGWRHVDPLFECVEKGEEVGDGLSGLCIKDQTNLGGGSASAPTWL